MKARVEHAMPRCGGCANGKQVKSVRSVGGWCGWKVRSSGALDLHSVDHVTALPTNITGSTLASSGTLPSHQNSLRACNCAYCINTLLSATTRVCLPSKATTAFARTRNCQHGAKITHSSSPAIAGPAPKVARRPRPRTRSRPHPRLPLGQPKPTDMACALASRLRKTAVPPLRRRHPRHSDTIACGNAGGACGAMFTTRRESEKYWATKCYLDAC